MYGKVLTKDSWRGVACDEHVVSNPTEADLVEAIDALDGKVHTIAIVGAEGDAHLAVGGGRDRFVVYATYDNATFHNLKRLRGGEAIVRLVVGGQEGEYPADQVVDRDQAVRAATRFLLDGRLGDDLGWEVQR
jgi:hypothetical protein